MASTSWMIGSALFLLLFLETTRGQRIAAKIVDEPSNYGLMHNFGGGNSAQTQENKLKLRIKPSNFSGPDLFRRLTGKCFTKIDEAYKYEFCPFSNVTQHEQSLRWNPYSGVLGVWQEWDIINNTFVAMVMREGDKCGKLQRTARVEFTCGKENRLLNVSEPSTCNYLLVFQTPYICHKHAMLVYPTLSPQLQTEWGLLEGELDRGEITKKGYHKYLGRIFAKAGYCLTEAARRKIADDAVNTELEREKEKAGDFDTLYQCKDEYQKLKKEIEGLRALLELNKQDKNMDPHVDHHDDYLGMMDDV